jgi:hypothetical protein
MAAADRYLRTGTGTVPQIYPATAAHLSAAIRAAQLASCRLAGEHFIEAVYAGKRLVLQVYEDGECTWIGRSANQP